MRILLVSDFYPPFLGGTERQVQLLGQELAERGHTVDVATIWHVDLPAEEQDGRVTVHRLRGMATQVSAFYGRPSHRRFHPPFPDPRVVDVLRKLFEQLQPDVVHAYGWIAYSCAIAVRGRDVPFVISVQDYGYSCPTRTLMHHGKTCEGSALGKCLVCASRCYGIAKGSAAVLGVFACQSLLKRSAAAVHSISTYVQSVIRRDLLRGQPDGGPFDCVIPPVQIPKPKSDPDNEDATRACIDRLPSEPFILFVGALQAHKGLQVLLDAYTQLASPPPLVLIGTVWPDTPRQFPPAVTVIENVPYDAVMLAWRRCLFGVLPSLWAEPFGGVVMEAMSAGKAVIGTTPGGHTDMIVSGETGILVPSGDSGALAKAIQEMASSEHLREQYGQAALRRTELFRSDALVQRYEALYQRLIRGETA